MILVRLIVRILVLLALTFIACVFFAAIDWLFLDTAYSPLVLPGGLLVMLFCIPSVARLKLESLRDNRTGVALLLSALAVGTGYWIWQQGSFEECVLKEMRGQARELTRIAIDLCQRRYPRQVQNAVSSPAPPKWVAPTEPNSKLDFSGLANPVE